jgi:hypothetical protein
MKSPIETLKKELEILKAVAAMTRSSQKRREAKELILQFEKAIEVLTKP